DLDGPGVDAPGEVIDRLESLPLEECDDLQTSHPMMTNTDDGLRRVELVEAVGQAADRHVLVRHAGQADGGHGNFPWLANVQQQCLRCSAMGSQFLDGELFHQNLKRLGSSKP